MTEIQIDEKYIISRLQNGVQMNPYYSADLDAYALNMKKRGWKTWNGDGLLHAEVHELIIDELLLIMSLDGGEVYNFDLWVKILTADLNKNTPIGLVNGTIDDRQKTWYEWVGIGKPTISVTEIDDYTYFPAHLGNKGYCLTGSELMVIHNDTLSSLITQEDVPVIYIES